ncbi:MAG: hypothetical protein HQL11_00210 [Candidatus Omnitrophica bacterium]|nr:hypothetical protein [Candidatus Omnitrophota bacterium]
MTRRLLGAVIVAAGVGLMGVTAPAADDDGMVIKKINGIRMKVPADMPIQTKGNVVEFMPMEEYLQKKVHELSARIDASDAKIKSLEEEVAQLKMLNKM